MQLLGFHENLWNHNLEQEARKSVLSTTGEKRDSLYKNLWHLYHLREEFDKIICFSSYLSTSATHIFLPFKAESNSVFCSSVTHKPSLAIRCKHLYFKETAQEMGDVDNCSLGLSSVDINKRADVSSGGS